MISTNLEKLNYVGNNVDWWNIWELSNCILRMTCLPWLRGVLWCRNHFINLSEARAFIRGLTLCLLLRFLKKNIKNASKYVMPIKEIVIFCLVVVADHCHREVVFRALWVFAMFNFFADRPFLFLFLLCVARGKRSPSCEKVKEYNLQIYLVTHYCHWQLEETTCIWVFVALNKSHWVWKQD